MALSEERIHEIEEQLKGLPPEEKKAKLQEIMESLPEEERNELMGGNQQCPFCLMVEGKIPVKKVFEDDFCIAILDINPANKGHTLLFPKKHYQFVAQIPDDEAAHLFKIANKISKAAFEALNAQGTNIIAANGAIAGQRAPHAIINIIPRFEGDKVAIGWQPEKIEDGEMEKIAISIASRVQREKPVEIKHEEKKPSLSARHIKRIA